MKETNPSVEFTQTLLHSLFWQEAEIVREQLCAQPSLFAQIEQKPILHAEYLTLRSVTHQFAYSFLRKCSQVCGLGFLDPLYQDLALMRIVEPASKLRTLELLQKYFGCSYASEPCTDFSQG